MKSLFGFLRRKPKPSKPTEWPLAEGFVRRAILAELSLRGMSRNALAVSLGERCSACRAFLYGGREAKLATVEAMLIDLGLALVSTTGDGEKKESSP